ncbi:MAG: VWA domain-containing protein, partial [Acidimicrobiia bacterium]|nr:VWA domain-containing protein [Acidimicrobiia bacterium]
MRRLLSLLLAVLATTMVATLTPVGAQDGGVDEVEVVEVSATDTGLVELTVAAPGALAGRDLPAEAFAVVSENTERPFSIRRVPDNELDIVLVFDTSNSMAGAPLDAAKDAALSFLRLLPPTARVAVVSFDFDATVVAPFTTELDTLVEPIQSLETDGDTAMYDGVIAGVDLFSIDRTERRTVVLLSDGSDTASAATLQQAARAVRQRQADMYAVGLGNQADTDALSRLVGDGRVLTAQDTSALAPVYDDIAALLGNQYVLVFDPLRDGEGTGAVFINHLGVAGQVSFDYDTRAVASSPSGQAVEQPVAPSQATPIRTSVVESTWVAGDTALLLGLAFLAIALFAAGWLIFSADRRGVSLAVNAPTTDAVTGAMGGTTERLTDLTDRMLERKGRGRIVALSLERAGLALRPPP